MLNLTKIDQIQDLCHMHKTEDEQSFWITKETAQ